MGIIFDAVNNLLDNHAKMKVFETDTNRIDCIVKAQNFPKFIALRDKENHILYTLFDKYTFRQNDQIIDNRDVSYFIEDTEPKFEYKLKDVVFIVNKITYKERPLALPNYLSQATNNITISVNNSNVKDITANNTINQIANYSQILNDLENVVNNCYNIKEYREMLTIIKDSVQKNKPVEESKLKKFFKFMGTQVKSLVEIFLTAYATALANKCF